MKKIVEIFTAYGMNIIGEVLASSGKEVVLKNPGRIVYYPNITTGGYTPTIYPILLLTNNSSVSILIEDISSIEEIKDYNNINYYNKFLEKQHNVV